MGQIAAKIVAPVADRGHLRTVAAAGQSPTSASATIAHEMLPPLVPGGLMCPSTLLASASSVAALCPSTLLAAASSVAVVVAPDLVSAVSVVVTPTGMEDILVSTMAYLKDFAREGMPQTTSMFGPALRMLREDLNGMLFEARLLALYLTVGGAAAACIIGLVVGAPLIRHPHARAAA